MYRRYLLSAASVAAVTAIGAAPASAFETIDWDWYLDAKTEINVDVDVDIAIDPAGATIVEIDQDFKGDLDAYATVDWVVNDPDNGEWKKICHGYYRKYCRWVFDTWSLDAVYELPGVENTAAAIGNIATVESEVSVQADINQTAVDNDYYYYGANYNAVAGVYGVRNAAVENTAQAIGNVASITLDPTDLSSGGHLEVDGGTGNKHYGYYYRPCRYRCGGNEGVGADGFDTDFFLMANIDQYANLDAYASATVYDVHIAGYHNLNVNPDPDVIGRNIVTNNAIAAGNVASVIVQSGALD